MTLRLDDIRACLEGVIPSIIATIDEQGMPNVSYLSQVYYVDSDHVALSNQFFSKTAANVERCGQANLLAVDGRSGDQFELDIVPVRRETSGDLFTRMSVHLDAMTAGHHASGVMKLRSADVYRVRSIRAVASPAAEPMSVSSRRAPPLESVAAFVDEIAAAPEAGTLLDRVLNGLALHFGYVHAMVLIAEGDEPRLVMLASHGYEEAGVGSEVAFGEGIIGLSAAVRVPVRICDMSRGRRYVEAAASAASAGPERSVTLPELAAPRSQLAVPLLAQGRAVGVLFAESEECFAFSHEDEAALRLVAVPLAASLAALEAGVLAASGDGEGRQNVEPPAGAFRLRHHRFDDAVFLDDVYLIKGVAGRLLMLLIADHLQDGRTEFTNQHIRRWPELRLPELKDNLETRLLLLRRRLDEKDAPIRLIPAGRGRIRLEMGGRPSIESLD